ncbi:SAM-dependent methyltransferase [Lipingzhangella halophila]|uniref:SAM-dependent methyltransferase n=1 Tax=Lipingzhangella halophila TaxID=1783352 RepID=A0A7W7RKF4_9ACTN|nr:class I SAM-dependent methyltransferase [Lipingzhangella halophila]MBB4933161.1 SAM-dependent methyltransferase [Lipingzhangella halophila]
MTPNTLDQARVEEFAGNVLETYTRSIVTLMIDLGYRTGLFESAAQGPTTSEGLAERAGLQERYVREWLAAMTTAGIVEFDATARTYTLPAEHAACLTGPGAANLAPLARVTTHLAEHVPRVASAFREGGGVPYSEYRPEFTNVMDSVSRNFFDEHLVERVVPLAPGLPERLAAGARVADVGCGTGHAVVLLAKAFPGSTFVGYDLAEDAIAQARAEAAEAGADNAYFEVRDAAKLTADPPYDAVLTFDCIHDQADPAGVLERINAMLVPGGNYVMMEPAASSLLEENVANPVAPLLYGVSTLHCMTVSLASGGVGLGTAWGAQMTREYLAHAGFGPVLAYDAPDDPLDTIFVTHKPETTEP